MERRQQSAAYTNAILKKKAPPTMGGAFSFPFGIRVRGEGWDGNDYRAASSARRCRALSGERN
jgi:hypothetical protein